MFDFAWSELALIAVVALVVIGPKDLPRVMRTLGFWVRRARAVAREFQGSVEQMMREAELDDVRDQVERAARFNVAEEIERHIDPGGELRSSLSDPALHTPLRDLPPPLPTAPSLPPAAASSEIPASPPQPAETAVPETPWQPAPAPEPQPVAAPAGPAPDRSDSPR